MYVIYIPHSNELDIHITCTLNKLMQWASAWGVTHHHLTSARFVYGGFGLFKPSTSLRKLSNLRELANHVTIRAVVANEIVGDL